MKSKYVLKNKIRFWGFLLVVSLMLTATVLSKTVHGYNQVEREIVIVREGDTLWGLAQKYNDDKDIRKYIYEIKSINKLDNGEIYPGNELVLPAN